MSGWMYLAAGLAALAMVSALFFSVVSYLDGLDAKGYARGVEKERAAWLERENEELTGANAEIVELTNKYRKLEQESAANMADIAAQHEKDQDNAQAQRDADIAAVVAGSLKLRDPDRAATGPADCGGTASQAAASPAGGDSKAGAEFSGAATAFLLNEANRADEIVRQLNRAIDVIQTDRMVKICG